MTTRDVVVAARSMHVLRSGTFREVSVGNVATASMTEIPALGGVLPDHSVAMQVRGVAAGELDRLREIRLRALLDAPQAFGSRFVDEEPRDSSAWSSWVSRGATFVAEDQAGWHGIVAVFPSGEDGEPFQLISMWVEPEHRGQGLGTRLLDAGVAWAQQQDADSIELGVAEHNPGAYRLYEHAGFTPTGVTEPLRSDPARNVIFMARSLPGRRV